MLQELTVNFSNILLSLSDAMDFANPKIASHQLRTAFIAWKLSLTAGLPKNKVENIYLAALLHDIGALSLEEKIQLHAGFENITPDTHCILGEVLFELSPLLKPCAKIVRNHHRAWREWQQPIDSSCVTESQIVCLADEIERMVRRRTYILHQVDKIRSKIQSMRGSKFHPDIVDVFMDLSRYEDFWLDLASPRLYSLLLHVAPFRKVELDPRQVSSMASLFRNIIDFKSRFTATHSTGVAECAVMLSQYFGFTTAEMGKMKVAGYFHDLGKLAVPNSVLEKPGKLTKDEFDVIKQHAYFTYSVLSSIGGFHDLAEWAAFHHEKLDGSGYPFHITGDRINLGARILAVADMFTALNEDRPYRKGMERKRVAEILRNQAKHGLLDERVVSVLLENYGEISPMVKAKQERSVEIFERKFILVEERQKKWMSAYC